MVKVVDPKRKFELIKKQACFTSLPDEDIEGLAELLVEREYKPDEVIVKQGAAVDSVFFIVDGTADVRYNYIEDNQRKHKSLAKLSTNQSIGLSATGLYSLSGVRTATVVAETEMLLLRLSIAELNGFALANPKVGQILHRNATASE